MLSTNNIFGKLFATPYNVDRGGKSGHVVGGGDSISFDEKVYGVTESYDGATLRNDGSGGYVGADGKSSLLQVEGGRDSKVENAKITDLDGTPNLHVSLVVDGTGNSRLKVQNPGDNGALSVLSFDFGPVQDSASFGTTQTYSGGTEKLAYIKSEGRYAAAIQNKNGTISIFGNDKGDFSLEEAPASAMSQVFG